MVTKGPVSYYKIVNVPDPVAGEEWTLTVPGDQIWRIESLVARLVTSAVVANRRAVLRADDQQDVWYAALATADQAASQTMRYGAFAGASPNGLAGVMGTIALPTSGLVLLPGYRLFTVTANLDAGDQWSQVRALVQSFPQGPDIEWLPTVDTQLFEMG